MTMFRVGDLYHPNHTSWPDGVAQYNYRGGQHELVLFFASPTEAEVEDVRAGAGRIHVILADPVIMLGYELGGVNGTAPYSWHLVPEDERAMPPHGISPEQRAMLLVFLVDAATGILRVMRQATMSPQVTRALHTAIVQQASQPWDQARYDAKLAKLYEEKDKALFARAVATCKLGE